MNDDRHLLNDMSGCSNSIPHRQWKYIGDWLTYDQFRAIRSRQERWRTCILDLQHEKDTPEGWLKWSLCELAAHLYSALLWWRPSWKLILYIAKTSPICRVPREGLKRALQRLRGLYA